MSLSAATELTRTLVRIDTVNPPGNERACIEVLAGVLGDAGFALHRQEFAPGRTSLVARIGKGERPLAFTGHVDTVPLGHAPWSVDPFGAEMIDGRMYGRGASDMKAGVAAFVQACLNRLDALRAGPGALLVITAGEETGCEGAFDLLQGAPLAQPSALVVGEPTANRIWLGHKGALWLRGTARGVTAHGAMPEKGRNAIGMAAGAIAHLADFRFHACRHAALGQPTLNVGTIRGGLNVNSVPDHCEFTLDLRTVPGQAHAEVRAAVAAHLGEHIELSPLLDVPPVWTDAAHPWIARVQQAVRETTGRDEGIAGASYFTDAAALQLAWAEVPVVILGPGEPAMAHQTDEYCLVERIDEAVAIYERLIDGT